MNYALSRLYACHIHGNRPSTQCVQHYSGTKAQVRAVSAQSPSQTLLPIITGHDRPFAAPQVNAENAQQQRQVVLQPDLQVHRDILRLQELVDLPAASASLSQQQLQQQSGPGQEQQLQPQRIRQRLWQIPHASQQTALFQKALHAQQQCTHIVVQSQKQPSLAPGQALKQQQQHMQQRLLLQQLQEQHRQVQQQEQLQRQLRRGPAALTALIKRTSTWQQLHHLFGMYTTFLNPLHVSAAITHLAQLQRPLTADALSQQPEPFQQLVKDLVLATITCIPDFGVRQLANSLWAISKLGAGGTLPRKTRRNFLDAFKQRLPAAAPQHISNVASAVANMGWQTHLDWRKQLLEAAYANLDGFNPQELANLVYALPMLKVQLTQQGLSALLAASHSSMPSFNSQELSLLGMGLVKLNQKPNDAWLADYMQAVQQQWQATSSAHNSLIQPQHHAAISNLHSSAVQLNGIGVNATAVTIHSSDSATWSINSTTDSTLLQPAGFTAQGFTIVLWVLAAWGVPPEPGWQHSCIVAAQQLVGQLTMQGVSTVIWAMARLQVPVPDALLQELLLRSQQLLAIATLTDCAMMLWGLGSVAYMPDSGSSSSNRSRDSKTLSQLAAIGSGLDGIQPSGSSRANNSMPSGSTSQKSSRTSNSKQSASSSFGGGGSSSSKTNHSWLSDLMYHSHRALPSASAKDIACLLAGAVRLKLQPGQCWVQAVAVEAHHKLHLMNATELAGSLLSLARLHYRPHAAFMNVYCSCSSRLLAAQAPVSRAAASSTISDTAVAWSLPSNVSSRRLRASSTVTGSAAAAAQHISQSNAASSVHALRQAQYCPQTLANTLGAMVMLSYKPPQHWSASFLAASRQLLGQFSARDFSYTIWALAMLDIQPPQQWMDAFLVHLRKHLPGMTSSQLSPIIWALARLEHKPGVDWMQRFLNRVIALTNIDDNSSSSNSSESDGTASRLAPRSPLQLSTDFSSIVLHGLTAWAAARLEYEGSGVGRGSSATRQTSQVLAVSLRRSHATRGRRHRGSAVASSQSSDTDNITSTDSSEVSDAQTIPARSIPVSTTVAGDGGIVYHF